MVPGDSWEELSSCEKMSPGAAEAGGQVLNSQTSTVQ